MPGSLALHPRLCKETSAAPNLPYGSVKSIGKRLFEEVIKLGAVPFDITGRIA